MTEQPKYHKYGIFVRDEFDNGEPSIIKYSPFLKWEYSDSLEELYKKYSPMDYLIRTTFYVIKLVRESSMSELQQIFGNAIENGIMIFPIEFLKNCNIDFPKQKYEEKRIERIEHLKAFRYKCETEHMLQKYVYGCEYII